MKHSDLNHKWWHRLALAMFWLLSGAAVLVLVLAAFAMSRGGFGAHDYLELTLTVTVAIVVPPIFWGLYRLVRWVAIGRIEPETPRD